MQHLCARLKVNVITNIHTITLSGECAAFFISHQVILDILCRQFHIIRTARIYPSITAISISCHIKLSFASCRHDDIREQHRHETIFSGISLVSQIAVTISLLQRRFISTLPVGIIIPVACSTGSSPYQILGHHLHVNRKSSETSICSIITMLFKMYSKGISISFFRLETETICLRSLRIKIYFHVVLKRRLIIIFFCIQ